jgi:hypothetical protein
MGKNFATNYLTDTFAKKSNKNVEKNRILCYKYRVKKYMKTIRKNKEKR